MGRYLAEKKCCAGHMSHAQNMDEEYWLCVGAVILWCKTCKKKFYLIPLSGGLLFLGSRGKVDADLNCSKKSFPLIVLSWLIHIVRRLCEGRSLICFTFFGLTVFFNVWFQVNCEHLERQWRWGWRLQWQWCQRCKLFANFRAFIYLHISHLSFPDTTIITIGAWNN